MRRYPVDVIETLAFNHRDARLDFICAREDYRRDPCDATRLAMERARERGLLVGGPIAAARRKTEPWVEIAQPGE
jgi:hypothetical protein